MTSNTGPRSGGEGSTIRVARWLVDVVRPGGIFTKQDLIDEFPGVSQIDRRMRDLRPRAWQIDTNREDASLAPHELRFVAQGEPVWDKQRPRTTAISAKVRSAALMEAEYLCQVCGITAGQTFTSPPFQSATLTVSSVGGTLWVRCQRCKAGESTVSLQAAVEHAAALYAQLSPEGKKTVADWLVRGPRRSVVERAWSAALHTPGFAGWILEDTDRTNSPLNHKDRGDGPAGSCSENGVGATEAPLG